MVHLLPCAAIVTCTHDDLMPALANGIRVAEFSVEQIKKKLSLFFYLHHEKEVFTIHPVYYGLIYSVYISSRLVLLERLSKYSFFFVTILS